MVRNDLTPENILEKGRDLAFPDSTIAYFEGMMGQPLGGFPQELQELVLKGRKPITVRLENCWNRLTLSHPAPPGRRIQAEASAGYVSYALYPRVFGDYLSFRKPMGI